MCSPACQHPIHNDTEPDKTYPNHESRLPQLGLPDRAEISRSSPLNLTNLLLKKLSLIASRPSA